MEKEEKMKPRTPYMTIAAIFTVILAIFAAYPCAAEKTLTVTSTGDSGDGTLREALESAVDGDTIKFNLELPATITLTSGPLEVKKSVSIEGPGRDLAIDGNNTFQVFRVIGVDEQWALLNVNATISHLTIANGNTSYEGGGVSNYGATLALENCELRNNEAVAGGGGISSSGPLVITDCTLSGNSAGVTEDYYGGGAVLFRPWFPATLKIERSELIGNNAPWGSGVSIYDGDVSITNSTISDNGLDETFSQDSATGGGIYIVSKYYNITVTVENCVLSGNYSRFGGAIYSLALDPNNNSSSSSLILKNSTLSGNRVCSGGGAIINESLEGGNATVRVDNCTLSDNKHVSECNEHNGFGMISNGASSSSSTSVVELKNTILDSGEAWGNLYNDDAYGAQIVSYGNNLSSDLGGGFLIGSGDLTEKDPMLGPLADNGGPTRTHALLEGSPAIDAGSGTDIAGNSVSSDQRGVSRPQRVAHDIGAFELESSGYVYTWSGVLPPINPDGTSVFKVRSTVSVKFMLTGEGAGISDLDATFSYAKISDGTIGQINEGESAAVATSGNLFHYDTETDQYIYNWSTRGQTPGTYRLFIDLGDGVERSVDIGLR
jgi:hypothetical protein